MAVQSFCFLLDQRDWPWILDVRSHAELEFVGRVTDAHHIHLTELIDRMNEIPMDQTIFIFCGSGLRSMIAANVLNRSGWQDLVVILGGLVGGLSVVTNC